MQLLLLVIIFQVEGKGSDSSNIIIEKNIAFVTFGGKENFGSANYERIFSTRKKWNWSYSVGVQPFSMPRKFSVPLSLNTFTTGTLHHFELDLAVTFYMDKFHPYSSSGEKEDFNKQLYISPFVCYRLQGSKGLVFKTGVGPQVLIDPPSDNILKFRTRFLRPAVFGSIGISF